MNEQSVEQGLQQLEALVAKLESDEVGLDEALQLFESGVKLADQLQKKLEESELRIKQVLESSQGFSVEDFSL